MKSFQDECSELAPLETFDPAAFQGDADVPQELCNLVLSLALVYNDCKDVIYSHILLGESRPSPPAGRNRPWGAWLGVDFHIYEPSVFSFEAGWTSLAGATYHATSAGQALGLDGISGPVQILTVAGRWAWRF